MYDVGTVLQIGVNYYRVGGWVEYRDPEDGITWTEYLLTGPRGESWLTIEPNKPMELSALTSSSEMPTGYQLVEEGTQTCIRSRGPVDTDPGESARYQDYSDGQGHTFSIERWNGETEYSRGILVNPSDFRVVPESEAQENNYIPASNTTSASLGKVFSIGAILLTMFLVFTSFLTCSHNSSDTDISAYAESNFTYVTSITGQDNQRASVYSTPLGVESAANSIIASQEGNFVQVQASDDGESVALLSNNEYCLVYKASSENDVLDIPANEFVAATTWNEETTEGSDNVSDVGEYDDDDGEISDGTTLIQVSTRKFAYENDSRPYRCRPLHYRYWRDFYSTFGYELDSSRYSSSNSPYANDRGSTVSVNQSDSYSNYSSSVREQAAAARSRSGGGTSSGK